MIGNGKYVSLETIIAKVYRDLGLSDSINIGDAIEWAGEAMDLIGATIYLEDKVEAVDIREYKGKLPCELHYIRTASANAMSLDQETDCDIKSMSFTPMRYTTDTYHHWKCGKSQDHLCTSDVTYNINDDFIFTSFEEGKVLISYRALPVDSRGYPKVPDDSKFKEAVAAHIKWRLGFIRWSNGKMPGAVYQVIERDRDWYIGAAQNRDKMPGMDMLESIKNNWLRLIPKINQHKDGFKSAGSAEQRFTHNS
jgi:hypothetical protein